MMNSININEKLNKFSEYWTPKIIAESNGQFVKLAKVKGEFLWHKHEQEDEMFIVVKGEFIIEFRNKTVTLNEGEMIVVPKGIEHRPGTSGDEACVIVIEPKGTYHTGNVKNERTVENQEWI
jgi:mannose-6-phosphate isomerase-like protein (cupin superfamily)